MPNLVGHVDTSGSLAWPAWTWFTWRDGGGCGATLAGRLGFWSVEDRLAEISAQGDLLETLAATVDFEMFRPVLARALGETPRWKGGRPGFDPVLRFRMLVLQSLHGLSLEATESLVRDRLSWMRFCRLGPGDRVPDANTLWDFREALVRAGALDALFGPARPGDHGRGHPAAGRADPSRTPIRDRGCRAIGAPSVRATMARAGRRAAPASHRGREGAGEGRPERGRALARQARQGAAEG